MDIIASNCTTSRIKNGKEFTIKSPTACDIIRAGRLCKQLIIFFTLFDEHPTRAANLLAFFGTCFVCGQGLSATPLIDIPST